MNRQPMLIGLMGPAGCGKSTVASYLEHLHSFEVVAFADPLVNMLASLLTDCNVGTHWMTERHLKEQPTPIGYSYRHLAQTLGTEWGRNTLHPDFWVRVAELRVNRLHQDGADVVLPDVRFPNEAEFVRSRGGLLVRIVRPGVETVREHESEAHQASLQPDDELLNLGGTSTLFEQVDRLVQRLEQQEQAREAAR